MPIIAQAPGVVAFSASGNASATTVSGTGTSAKIFPAAPSLGQAGTNAATVLTIPGSGRLEARDFRIKAGGFVTIGAAVTPTLTFTLYAGTSLPTVANQLTVGGSGWTAFVAGTASSATTAATSYAWGLDCSVFGSTVDGTLNGYLKDWCSVQTTNMDTVKAATQVTGVKFTNDPVAYLALACTFSASAAGNLAQLDYFYIYAD